MLAKGLIHDTTSRPQVTAATATLSTHHLIKAYMSAVMMFVISLLPVGVWAASFDCKKATNSVENMICGDLELNMLDERMGTLYANITHKHPAAELIAKDQKQWMKTRNTCKERDCIITAYQRRLNDIESESSNPQCISYSNYRVGFERYARDAALTNCDLMRFINDLVERGKVYDFIDAIAKQNILVDKPEGIDRGEHDSDKQYHLYPIQWNVDDKLLWGIYRAGTASCLHENFYLYSIKDSTYRDTGMYRCGDGNCCGDVDRGLFSFNGALYTIDGNDDFAHIDRVDVSDNDIKRVAGFSISRFSKELEIIHSSRKCFTNRGSQCEMILQEIEGKTKTIMDQRAGVVCNDEQDHPYVAAYPNVPNAHVSCCSADYNNDEKSDFACLTGGGPRWENNVFFLFNSGEEKVLDSVLMKKFRRDLSYYRDNEPLQLQFSLYTINGMTYITENDVQDSGLYRNLRISVFKDTPKSFEYIGHIDASAKGKVTVETFYNQYIPQEHNNAPQDDLWTDPPPWLR